MRKYSIFLIAVTLTLCFVTGALAQQIQRSGGHYNLLGPNIKVIRVPDATKVYPRPTVAEFDQPEKYYSRLRQAGYDVSGLSSCRQAVAMRPAPPQMPTHHAYRAYNRAGFYPTPPPKPQQVRRVIPQRRTPTTVAYAPHQRSPVARRAVKPQISTSSPPIKTTRLNPAPKPPEIKKTCLPKVANPGRLVTESPKKSGLPNNPQGAEKPSSQDGAVARTIGPWEIHIKNGLAKVWHRDSPNEILSFPTSDRGDSKSYVGQKLPDREVIKGFKNWPPGTDIQTRIFGTKSQDGTFHARAVFGKGTKAPEGFREIK